MWLAVLAQGVVVPAGHAHGPCACLKPSSGPPRTKVQAAYPSYKVIFNPDRADLTIGPRPLWARHHGPPPVVVHRRTWRYTGRPLNTAATFRVPRVPAGRYLVALYDGGEGGQHYSWETFTVTNSRGPRSTLNAHSSSSSAGLSIAAGLAAAAAALLVGYAVGARRRRVP
jgi:hypothetical protein